MAETLESIKQEIAKIAAEKADLKGIVDQQKETIERQETTIGNLQEALKAADANMMDRVNKLNKEIDEFKKYADDEHASNLAMSKENGTLTELKEDLKAELEKSKAEHAKTWEEKENFREKNLELKNEVEGLNSNINLLKAAHDKTWEEKETLEIKVHELKQQVALLESIDAEDHHEDVIELREQVAKLEAIRDTYAKEIDVLNGEIEELKANGSPGMVAALAAKDEELRKLGEKVPAKDREINDLKEQVKSKNQDLEQSYKEFNKLSLEKEHLVNAIENAYRSLMITRGYQLPGESGVSNG